MCRWTQGRTGRRLEAALSEAGNTDVTVKVLPTANHLFQNAKTGGVEEYASLGNQYVPDLFDTIATWINERVK